MTKCLSQLGMENSQNVYLKVYMEKDENNWALQGLNFENFGLIEHGLVNFFLFFFKISKKVKI